MDMNDALVKLIIAEASENIDTQAGMATTSQAYYKGLPKGVKREVADQVNAYNVNFLAAQGLAAGQIGAEQFADSSYKEDDFTISSQVPNMEFNSRVQREVTIGDDTYTNYLVSSATIHGAHGEDDILASVARQVGEIEIASSDNESDAA